MVGFGVGRQVKKATVSSVIPQIKTLVKKMELQWPNNEGKVELQWLQDNYNYIYEFEKRLYQAHSDARQATTGKNNTKVSRPERLLWHLRCYWPGGIHVLRDFAFHINQSYAWNNPRWTGTIRRFTINHKNDKWLMNYCSRIIAEFTGDGADFYNVVLPWIKRAKIETTDPPSAISQALKGRNTRGNQQKHSAKDIRPGKSDK